MKGNFIYIVDKEPLCEERLAMSYNNHFSNSFFSQSHKTLTWGTFVFGGTLLLLAVLIFAYLLLKGYKNKNLNHNLSKFFVGGVAGTVNGFGTLAGLPIALYFLIIAAEPAVIRASLAALFFFTDFYALLLAYFENILNYKLILRTIPLIFIVPIGVFLGTKLFTGSSKENYKKYVLYFLIVVSIFGLIRTLI